MYDGQKKQISLLQLTLYKDKRKHTKGITQLKYQIDTMNLEVATLEDKNRNIIKDVSSTEVKIAVKEAILKEIQQQLKEKQLLKKVLGNKCIDEICKLAPLQMKFVDTESKNYATIPSK